MMIFNAGVDSLKKLGKFIAGRPFNTLSDLHAFYQKSGMIRFIASYVAANRHYNGSIEVTASSKNKEEEDVFFLLYEMATETERKLGLLC